jgi:2-polyprenyl-6-methoxyphenol hydroxylase-like FAD-dependent oxidoreductase
LEIVVIGAGIAGLTFALAAHRYGHRIRLYEAAPQLAALGVGINLQPNAVRELTELGLGSMLAETAIETSDLAYFNKFGQRIWIEPRGRAAGYRWPQNSIHRGDLQMLLLKEVRTRLGPDCLLTGHVFRAFEAEAGGIRAYFTDPGTREPLESAGGDMLVGADGIHSAVRRQLYPHEGAAIFRGIVAFRGAGEIAPYLNGRTMVVIGHRDQRAVIYPISRAAADRGRSLANWVCIKVVPEDAPPPEQWNRRADKSQFIGPYLPWRFDWIDVPGLIEATPEIFQFPFLDREPIPRWSFERVTLIGDAAHPMYPIGSQAGSQAVVDARVLGAAVGAFADPVEALARYEAMRMPAMNRLAAQNRNLGAENVLQIVEERAPDGFTRLADVISDEELNATSRDFKALAGLDLEAINDRPPYFGVG